MLAAWLGSLLVAATVGIRVDEASQVSPEDVARIGEEVRIAVAEQTKAPAVLDDPRAPACKNDARCLDDVRARTGARELLLVQVFGSLTRIRLLGKRVSERSIEGAPVSVDVDREAGGGLGRAASELAAKLFPPPLVEPAAAPIGRVKEEVGPARITPWVVIGASGFLAAVGAVSALGSAHIRTRIEEAYHPAPEVERLQSEMRVRAATADVLWGVSVLGVALGVTLLLSD